MDQKKKFLITMKKDFCILASNETEAEELAIERCADDPETLMPHNMEVLVETSILPDSYFD